MKKVKILIPILASCALLGACNKTVVEKFSNNSHQLTSEYKGYVVEALQKDTYFIDDYLTVGPKNIVYEDKVYTCTDFYVIFPNGSQKTGSKFKLTLEGEYKIVYLAEKGDIVVEAVEVIHAYKKAFSVTKDSSVSQYVDSIICDQKNPTGGIQTYLSEGDTWTYNQPIDISKANNDQPIIKYYTRQSSELANHVSLDVTSTVIRLTDFYDSTNYVEIYNTYNETNSSTHRMQPYVLAGCNGQPLSGIDPTNRSSKSISYEGNNYYLHNSNKLWGACLDTVPGRTGINGTKYDPDIANSDNRGFSVFFDADKLTISVRHNLMHIVTDLDEPAIYSNNLFKGFTTGEVILSMRCEGYKESQGFFEISEINGKKGEELNTEYAYDEVAPHIHLDNTANDFYIACNEPFEIFHATATDPNLIGEVSCQVFSDYGTNNQRFIPVTNNTFTPTSIGQYSIVYSATDKYGNKATKIVTCNCVNVANNQMVKLDFNPAIEADAGSSVSLPTPIVTSYNEGTYYKIKAVNELNNDTVLLDNDNLNLFLKYAGDYKIVVEYGDVSCSKIKEYAFKSNPSNNAYLETTVLPRYILKDTYSTLDNNRVVLCNDIKPSYVLPQVYVKNDNGEYSTNPIDVNSFVSSADESVQFKYVYNGQTIYESESIPVIDVDYFGCPEFSKYFEGDLDSRVTDEGVSFNTTQVGGDAEVTFVNPLSFNLFRLELIFDSKLRYKSIDLVMEDYYGIQEDFVITFFYSGNILCFLNGGIKGEIGVVDYTSLSYDSNSGVLALGQGVSLNVANVFPSDKIYLSFRLHDLKAGTTAADENKIFTVKSINNQILSSMAYGGDFNPPQISYSSLKGQRNIGEVIHIRKSYVCDVLSPYYAKSRYVKVTYSKTASSDSEVEIVISTDGVTLDGTQDLNRDYDVLLDKHGVYKIIYYYQDQTYQDVTLVETIYVEDNEAPEITINGADNKTIDIVSFGSEVTVRGYKVNDQQNVTVTIFAMSPQNTLIRLNGKKFTPDMKGDWRIIYYASDENGNVSSASYILRVK